MVLIWTCLSADSNGALMASENDMYRGGTSISSSVACIKLSASQEFTQTVSSAYELPRNPLPANTVKSAKTIGNSQLQISDNSQDTGRKLIAQPITY